MEFVGRLLRFLIELTALGWMLVTHGLCFMALCTRSRAALTAENVFLRKQLALYQEWKVVPRRFDNAASRELFSISATTTIPRLILKSPHDVLCRMQRSH